MDETLQFIPQPRLDDDYALMKKGAFNQILPENYNENDLYAFKGKPMLRSGLYEDFTSAATEALRSNIPLSYEDAKKPYASYMQPAPAHTASSKGLQNPSYAPLLNSFNRRALNNIDPKAFLGSKGTAALNINSKFSKYDLLAPKLKPEDLPELTLPILAFIEDVRPHIIIGCDRGARLFGVAVHATWQQTHPGQPFPTLDGKVHFARLSTTEDDDVLQDRVDHIVDMSKRFGRQRGNEVDETEQLRVLFLDDWVIGGGTMRMTRRLMEKHKAQTYFAVMCGDGADVSGQPQQQTNVSWHDRPEEIGVNYLSAITENPDGSITQRQEVLAIRGVAASTNRRLIHEAAQAVSQNSRQLQAVA